MTTPPDALCDKCRQREARIFLTKIVDGVSESSRLCNECSDAAGMAEIPGEAGKLVAELQAARCGYCGAQPCTGDNKFMSNLLGPRQHRFMCMPCQMEFFRFIQTGMQALQEQQNSTESAAKSPPEKQLAALRAVLDKADEHMKQWVSGGGNQDHAT
jgi:protein-arginine kinase activator protein McsA